MEVMVWTATEPRSGAQSSAVLCAGSDREQMIDCLVALYHKVEACRKWDATLDECLESFTYHKDGYDVEVAIKWVPHCTDFPDLADSILNLD